MTFRALRVHETSTGIFERRIEQMNLEDLPPGDLLIRVHYAALNYKDALSATGNKGITRKYPHTPGVDAAGIVEISRSEKFAVHDEVVVTGFDLGMNTNGGFADYIRVPATWAVKKPSAYSLHECMVIGTAGMTAAAALHKMQLIGQTPQMGPVVVTGSTGGVGSLSVALLAKAGFDVIAVSGKTSATEYLNHLGAKRIEPRSFVTDESGRALLRPLWAGAIDTVGGTVVNTLLKACKAEGSIVSTGLVATPLLNTTVYPFILNGVNLLGIGSAETPMPTRLTLWQKLEGEWNLKEKIPAIGKETTLEELDQYYIPAILEGRVMGRVVVSMK